MADSRKTTDMTETADLQRRLEALERRSARADRGSAFEAAFWAVMHNLFPEEARTHMRAAGREQLLAARAYLDHWIAKLEQREAENGHRRENIEIS
jgi:hypothetical protein